MHMIDGVADGNSEFLIRTIDTDVVVLAVAMSKKISIEELWIAFGTGKKFRYLAIHEIVKSFSPRKAIALPFFHAFTGCDTVSYFHSKGKKSCWKVWHVMDEATEAFHELLRHPETLKKHMSTLNGLWCSSLTVQVLRQLSIV